MPAPDLVKLGMQSANAGQTPKPRSITKNVKAILRGEEFLTFGESGFDDPVSHKTPLGLSVAQMLGHVAVSRAIAGDHFFFKEVLDRTEGKVPTRLANADGKNLPSQVVMVEICLPQPVVQHVVSVVAQEVTHDDHESGNQHSSSEDIPKSLES